MLRNFEQTRAIAQWQRLAVILIGTLILALSAKISINIGGPVPFTMQVLAVLLVGMVLGARDGAGSILAYLGLIASGMPIDAWGLGPAAFQGPTAGYLFGFVGAAFIAGWLVESGWNRWWMRWLAGLVALVVIYSCGITVLKYRLGLSWSAAWEVGIEPFILLDVVKALLAATMTESGRRWLTQYFNYGR
jgi:biotin transport system substrate-specific component